MRLLGNILAVDSLLLLSDLSLAAPRPKRSSRRRRHVVNHIDSFAAFLSSRSSGENRAGTHLAGFRGGLSLGKYQAADNLPRHSRGMIAMEGRRPVFSISCETRAGVTLHHLDNAIDALAIVENIQKETQLPIVITNRATGQVLTIEELRRVATLERSRADRPKRQESLRQPR
jgi:hypothetical protein